MYTRLSSSTDDRRSERAVSDLVAFVLTFSIIITSVAFVSMFGLGTLEEAGDGARAESAEAAMIGFHDSLDDVRTGEIPRRTTEFQLNSDGIAMRESDIWVNITRGDGGTENRSFDVGSFARSTGRDATIVYETGAVYREEPRGQVGVRAPSFRCGSDTAHVALVKLTDDTNFASDNAVTLSAERTDAYPFYPDTGAAENGAASDVTLNVTGAHNQAAWDQLFDRRLKAWDGAAGSYTCDGVSRVFVHVTAIEVSVVS